VKSAGTHGWVPYTTEPWHWEYPLDPVEYRSEAGVDIEIVATDDADNDASTSDLDFCEADGICKDVGISEDDPDHS